MSENEPVTESDPNKPVVSANSLQSSIAHLRLLDALRSGNTAKISEIVSDSGQSSKPLALHYAVQLSPLETVSLLINDLNFDANQQDLKGNTPLHLAAQAGRSDVVAYLLSLDDINDTLTNNEGKTPLDISRSPEISTIIQVGRAKYVEHISTLLKTYFNENNYEGLEKILNNPRAQQLIDINGSDPDTGNTVLHDSIKSNNITMVKFILDHNGDPFKRDKKGKLPNDLSKNNEEIKKLIRLACEKQSVLTNDLKNSITIDGAPIMKGYLKKWTNFKNGYKLRWFVLEKCILSYYKDQDDIESTCRGSINMKIAKLHLDSSEKLKFEIIGKGSIKYHLKANHPIETNKWVWALQSAITYAKDLNKLEQQKQQQILTNSNNGSNGLQLPKNHALVSGHARNLSNVSVSDSISSSNIDKTELVTGVKRSSTIKSTKSTKSEYPRNRDSSLLDLSATTSIKSNEYLSNELNFDDDDDDDDDDSTMEPDYEYNPAKLPHKDTFQTTSLSLTSQLTALQELFNLTSNSLSIKENENENSKENENTKENSNENVDLNKLNPEDIKNCLIESINGFKSLNQLINFYKKQVEDRELYFLKIIEHETDLWKLWERSIKQMEFDHLNYEKKVDELENDKKKIGKIIKGMVNRSRGLSTSSGITNESDLQSTSNDDKLSLISDHENENDKEETSYPTRPPVTTLPTITPSTEESKQLFELIGDESSSDEEFFDAENDEDEDNDEKTSPPEIIIHPTDTPTTINTESEIDDDSKEKEIETSTTIIEEEPLQLTKLQQLKYDEILKDESYNGYENGIRTELSLKEDNRPKIGLWGILKSMVGKDLTKMTLPVSFNEPTSLLQRVTEDMEYTELLDKAVEINDSGLRMAYVSAFAASEYASTINRIAKPFNPLLGETFEYCRPDKNYRFMIEQVSHHPPIGAAYAESPYWDYYGESAVKSQFLGRSFDIRPLGTWFLKLRIKNGDEELYSWKKVQTAVVGIITGSPTIDNYGDMEIINHSNGDKCLMKYKARGWRGSNAFELKGNVQDSNEINQYTVGGRWNDKIYVKKVNNDNHIGDLEINSKELIWQVNSRPKLPFNLTSFALSLNDNNENILKVIPPTDTRLRPDQRAMEEGEYDLAANEKHRVEEKQRAAKKKREENGNEYKTKFFTKEIHPITKDEYWRYNGNYWKLRKEGKEKMMEYLGEDGDIF